MSFQVFIANSILKICLLYHMYCLLTSNSWEEYHYYICYGKSTNTGKS